MYPLQGTAMGISTSLEGQQMNNMKGPRAARYVRQECIPQAHECKSHTLQLIGRGQVTAKTW